MPIVYDTPLRREVGLNLVETTANLRLVTGVDREVAICIGTSAAFDRASITYIWDNSLTGAESGVAIIKPTAISTAGAGRWRAVSAT
jgi:hypothetical protein